MRFWLERGVDGFRLDTVNFYFHSQGLEIEPGGEARGFQRLDRAGGEPLQFPGTPLRQEPAGEPQVPASACARCSTSIRRTTSVGEIGDSQHQLEVMSEYTSGGDKLHMAYTFDYPRRRSSTPGTSRNAIDADRGRRPPNGWICLAFSNHDVVRHVEPLGDARPAGRLHAARRDAAALDARLGLPLPGRGAGADRGRALLRGSGRSLRHRVLAASSRAATAAARRWCGRSSVASRRLLHGARAPGCRCRPTT